MAVIRYIATGRDSQISKVAVSMNNGRSWQEKDLKAGQSFPIPPNATSLLINNVPYEPNKNYEIRQGKISQI